MINSTKDLKLAIIGLGYVGLPLALEFSKKMVQILLKSNLKAELKASYLSQKMFV